MEYIIFSVITVLNLIIMGINIFITYSSSSNKDNGNEGNGGNKGNEGNENEDGNKDESFVSFPKGVKVSNIDGNLRNKLVDSWYPPSPSPSPSDGVEDGGDGGDEKEGENVDNGEDGGNDGKPVLSSSTIKEAMDVDGTTNREIESRNYEMQSLRTNGGDVILKDEVQYLKVDGKETVSYSKSLGYPDYKSVDDDDNDNDDNDDNNDDVKLKRQNLKKGAKVQEVFKISRSEGNSNYISIKAKNSIQISSDVDTVPLGYPPSLDKAVAVLKKTEILNKPSENDPEHFDESQSQSFVTVNGKYGNHRNKIFWEESYIDLGMYSTLTGNPTLPIENRESTQEGLVANLRTFKAYDLADNSSPGQTIYTYEAEYIGNKSLAEGENQISLGDGGGEKSLILSQSYIITNNQEVGPDTKYNLFNRNVKVDMSGIRLHVDLNERYIPLKQIEFTKSDSDYLSTLNNKYSSFNPYYVVIFIVNGIKIPLGATNNLTKFSVGFRTPESDFGRFLYGKKIINQEEYKLPEVLKYIAETKKIC